MHKTIVVDGQEYELQITARRIINDGRTAVSMDSTETEVLLSGIEDDLRSAIGAIDYAAEQRGYEASFERDSETHNNMVDCARLWECLGDRLMKYLNEE